MSLRIVMMVVALAGCAAERLLVPEDDWQTVPAGQRAKVDQQQAASLAAARAEVVAATTGLAEAQKAQAQGVAPPRKAIGNDADWLRDHERARQDAFGRVEAARASWQRTNLAWSQLRLETAKERLEMVICEREAVRARTIDRSMLEGDFYDTAPLRGQFSKAQVRWYALNEKARAANVAFGRASVDLASAKEAYAQVMRNGPAELRSQPAVAAASERPARLELASWTVNRNDIRRRRGLRRYLDDAAAAPASLRRAKLQLAARAVIVKPSPTAEPVPAAPRPVEAPKAAAAPRPVEAPKAAAAPRPVEAPKAVAVTPAPKPAKPVVAPAEPSKAAATKPSASATLATAKPAAPPAKPPQPAAAQPASAEPLFPTAKPVERQ